MVARDLAALHAFIDSRHDMAHDWGRQANDCVGFALAAVVAQTGVDPAPELDWSDRAGALRAIRRFGSIAEGLDAHFAPIAPALAMRGDIAGVADDAFGIHPMIVEGDMLVGPGEKGNRRLPRAAMTRAWSSTAPMPDAA